mmetsp:Transcript_31486/g.32689  ORF Transcript_31486/g.32689 Transcript_31486/m.32689 type:complete len:85 (+) Transcript_31486:752-1006(+)
MNPKGQNIRTGTVFVIMVVIKYLNFEVFSKGPLGTEQQENRAKHKIRVMNITRVISSFTQNKKRAQNKKRKKLIFSKSLLLNSS